MKFGPVRVGDAEGAILAHAAKLAEGRIAKGTRLTAQDLQRLMENGHAEVVVATLEPDDLTEDEAAAAIGRGLIGSGIEAGPAGTGRVNLFAETNGVFIVRRDLIDAVNAVDPGITLATLAEYAPVMRRQMTATVKIIPLAVPGSAVEAATALLDRSTALAVSPYRSHRVVLVQTELPGTKASVLDKTRRAFDARLTASASLVVAERRCAHDVSALAAVLRTAGAADMVAIFGASAVIDADDVIPAAIRAAGGTVTQLGMPVDPGNLLLLGRYRGAPILGAPGCARSPKENGFDWILSRLLADVPVTSKDIRGMGVGGLLTEIPSRPQPRQGRARQ